MNSNPERLLRARGNLSYLEFVRLIGRIWAEAHPDIPFLPAGSYEVAQYPAVYYSLDLRRAHPNEPKPKYRETVEDDDGNHYVISAQRFQNVVKFTSVTESNPDLASEIIEEFEDFMLEYTPVFKELGSSELVYSRRYSDSEENRSGAGAVRRSVAYLLTTERIRKVQYNTLDHISIEARVWLDDYRRSTHNQDYGGMNPDSPRYYLYGPDEFLTFAVNVADQSPDSLIVRIPFTNFRPNDILHLNNFAGDIFPGGMEVGLYRVVSPLQEDGLSADKTYIVVKVSDDLIEDPDPIVITSDGQGLAFYVPNLVESNIVDEMGGIAEG